MLSTLTFAAPLRLLLLVAVVAVAVGAVLVRLRARRDRRALASPAMQASVLPPAGGGAARAVAGLLLVLGLVGATVGFARPQVLADTARERSVVLVTLDTSTSMLADDVTPTRLQAAVAAAQQFVRSLPPQVDVGLVTFASTARLVSPPTASHEAVVRALEGLSVSGGTALGQALVTGLASLPPELRTPPPAGTPPAARVVVLSDGGTTTGLPVDRAAAQARAAGVPVSTIAYGTDAGVVVQDGRSYPVPVDPAVLTRLADTTGGTAYRAADVDALARVYADIGSVLSRETARRELTAPVTGVALGLLAVSALLSVLRTGRPV